MPYCQNCGKEINDDANYCPSCGHQIKENEEN